MRVVLARMHTSVQITSTQVQITPVLKYKDCQAREGETCTERDTHTETNTHRLRATTFTLDVLI
jgi:hypothetical protein